MKKCQLVLQWDARSIQDFDAIVELENQLSEIMPKNSEVDGHDAGSGQMNIFIFTDAPRKIFDLAKPVLKEANRLANVRVAYREASEDQYTVLHPTDLADFKVT
jgi:hypothetical protein